MWLGAENYIIGKVVCRIYKNMEQELETENEFVGITSLY